MEMIEEKRRKIKCLNGNDVEMNEESDPIDEICSNNFTNEIYIADMDIKNESSTDSIQLNVPVSTETSTQTLFLAFLVCGKNHI